MYNVDGNQVLKNLNDSRLHSAHSIVKQTISTIWQHFAAVTFCIIVHKGISSESDIFDQNYVSVILTLL